MSIEIIEFEKAKPILEKALAANEIAEIAKHSGIISKTLQAFGCLPKNAQKVTTDFVAMLKNEKARNALAGCTPHSLVGCLAVAANNNYVLQGSQADAYLIPYNEKIKGADGKEITQSVLSLTVGYRGLIKQNPNIINFEYFVQRAGDTVVEGFNEFGNLIIKKREVKNESPDYGGSNFIAIYGYLVISTGRGAPYKTAMQKLTKAEVERLRKMNRGQNEKPKDAWWIDYEAMAAVKLARKIMKFAINANLQSAPEDGVYLVSENGKVEFSQDYATAQYDNATEPELSKEEQIERLGQKLLSEVNNLIEADGTCAWVKTNKADEKGHIICRYEHVPSRTLYKSYITASESDLICAEMLGTQFAKDAQSLIAKTEYEFTINNPRE